MTFAAFRLRTTSPVASTRTPLQFVNRIGNDIALGLKLALCWKQAGMLKAEGRAPDAGHAQHVNLRASVGRQLGGLGNRLGRDRTSLGGKKYRSCCDARARVSAPRLGSPSSSPSWRAMAITPTCHTDGAEGTDARYLAKRASSMFWFREPDPRSSSTGRTEGRRRARPSRPNSRSPHCRAASRRGRRRAK